MLVRQLFISPGHNYFGHNGRAPDDYPLEEVERIECVAGHGIRGDRFYDYQQDYKGQITFFSEEIFDGLRAAFPHVQKSPGVLRRNVIVAGVDLHALIGETFELQGVRLLGTGALQTVLLARPGVRSRNGGVSARKWWIARADFDRRMDQDRRRGVGVRRDVSVSFSAVLLAGGTSSRMGRDKAFIEIDGVPLWQRQLQILRQLEPHEMFIAGPAHADWIDACDAIVPDARDGVGPLAALVASLRRCSTPLLLTLAVDLPGMTTDYLRDLLTSCSDGIGLIPRLAGRFEPLAAVYPVSALPLAESCMQSRDYSLQRFAARCVSEGFARVKQIELSEEPFFLNMNTPEDLAAVSKEVLQA